MGKICSVVNIQIIFELHPTIQLDLRLKSNLDESTRSTYWGRIFSQAGNELGTSKARGIRDNHHETRSLLFLSSFPSRLKIWPLVYFFLSFRSDSLTGVCVSDHQYPNRVAHTLLTKILDDFTTQVRKSMSLMCNLYVILEVNPFFISDLKIYFIFVCLLRFLILFVRSRGVSGLQEPKFRVMSACWTPSSRNTRYFQYSWTDVKTLIGFLNWQKCCTKIISK